MRLLVLALVCACCAGVPYRGDESLEDGNSFRPDVMPFANERDENGDPLKPPEDIAKEMQKQHEIEREGVDFAPARGLAERFHDAEEKISGVADHDDGKDDLFNMGPLQAASMEGPNGVANEVAKGVANVANDLAAHVNDAKQLKSQMGLDNERAAPSIPAEFMKNFKPPEGDLGAEVDPSAAMRDLSAPPSLTAFNPDQKKANSNIHKSLEDKLGLPSLTHFFESIDQKLSDAREFWDSVAGQENIQVDTRLGIVKADETLADAETTNKAVLDAGLKADTSIAADKKSLSTAHDALDISSKVAQDGEGVQEAAKEAQRWMEKVLEKAAIAAKDSKQAQQDAAQAQKDADETLARDTAAREQLKAVYVQSRNAINEATEAKRLLTELKAKEEAVQADAAKAKTKLLEAKKEEEELMMREKRVEQEAEQTAKEQSEVIRSKEDEIAKEKSLVHELEEQLKAEKAREAKLEEELHSDKTELSETKGKLEVEHKAVEQSQEALTKQNEEQAKIIEEALRTAEEAKAAAASALEREQAAEHKAQQLEEEKEEVKRRMHDKLMVARQRTKEWLHEQTAQLAASAKDEDSKRQAELDQLRHEVADLKQKESEWARAAEAADKPAKPATKTFAKASDKVAAEAMALQVEEGETAAAKPSMSKQEMYDKLLSLHARIEKMVADQSKPSSTGVQDALAPAMDLEQSLDYRLARRKSVVSSMSSALPAGHPPPPGSAKFQMDALELAEGAAQPGYGDPQIAQGVNEASDVLKMGPAHRDNCLRICSGGDKTVYRDGHVSTAPDEQPTGHETGACMKLCAKFSIQVHEEACNTPPSS